jgi:phosphoribosylanthranilate isomerase
MRAPTRIKICGITNPADAERAADLGVNWVGLNFYAKSPRYIDEAAARSILQVLPASVEPVALFVNEPWTQMQQLASALAIGTIQVHGALESDLHSTQLSWFRALSVRDADDLRAIEASLATNAVLPTAILIDAHVPGMFGGTGQVAPWHLLADFKPGVPIILAGGLTPDNVAEAIRIVRPYAVDVASGVEREPGKKDAEKMRRFIDAARSA